MATSTDIRGIYSKWVRTCSHSFVESALAGRHRQLTIAKLARDHCGNGHHVASFDPTLYQIIRRVSINIKVVLDIQYVGQNGTFKAFLPIAVPLNKV